MRAKEKHFNVVAFLQNPWFHVGTSERVILRYRDDQEFHQRILVRCMSGRRLKKAFGHMFEYIWWDNCTWRPAWQASGKLEPDIEHMIGVIQRVNPSAILAFGRIACQAAHLVNDDLIVLECHHPNARHKTQRDLDNFAERVMRYWL